jgi:type I restriction enzyme, S subunit
MTSNGWKEVTLGEISLDGKGSYGIAASAVEYSDDLYTYLRITDINDDGTLNKTDLKSVDDEKAEKYLLQPNDIVFARTGNSTGRSYFYDGSDGELVYAGFLIKFSLDPSKVNPKFMRYYTLSNEYKGWVSSYISGSTRGNINAKTYANMKISLPPRKQQDYLVKVLSSLDEKIKTNNQINEKLEEMAQALFKHWFVDFEFPNENGEPYKSSGGEMVDSELGMIPKGWKVSKLSELITLYDSKRIPLSKNERDKREKIYPYYGASSLMDYVDDYIFDGVYVLLGEDGTVIDELGYPILQYVWGKFWVNNHAHVIKGKNDYSEEFVYMLLKNTNVSSAVTGAVQLKINQKNLKNLSVVIPEDMDLIKQFSGILDYQFSIIRNNSDQNKVLTSIRDNLLPKLMSGEIRIPMEDGVLSEKN